MGYLTEGLEILDGLLADLLDELDIGPVTEHAHAPVFPFPDLIDIGKMDTRNDVVFAGYIDDLLDGRFDHRIGGLAGFAQGGGEVGGAYEGHVDAGHREDFVQIFDGVPGFDLDGYEDFLVELGHGLGGDAGIEVGVLALQGHAAVAQGHVAGPGYDVLHVLLALDLGNEEAGGADVQGAGEGFVGFPGGGAHDDGDVGGPGGHDIVAHGLEIEAGVLGVEKEKVEAGVGEEGGHAGAPDFGDHGAVDCLSLLEGALHAVLKNHMCSLCGFRPGFWPQGPLPGPAEC
ncbi:hypothetical protein SDC9_05453 [bioreactor metagenome]|uniref:Uncharacterized protein n=2 Tax=root TaxID=1 RepID=A0A652ZUZ1_9SPIR|nr:hypothetical protein TRIP_E200048 [uncultured Spirochaetota bacterium]